MTNFTVPFCILDKAGGEELWCIKDASGEIISKNVYSYRAETTSFTFEDKDYTVEQQTSGVTDTLPTSTKGRIYVYANVAGGATTLQTTGGQTIYTTLGAVTSVTVQDGESIMVQGRPGGGWKII